MKKIMILTVALLALAACSEGEACNGKRSPVDDSGSCKSVKNTN